MNRRRPSVVVGALAGVAMLFFALPLVGILQQAPWREFPSLLSEDASISALRLSVICSVAATLLAVLFGLPLAWLLARTSIPGRPLIRALVLLPMVLPPVVGGVALRSAFSRQGLLGAPLYDHLGVQLTFTTLAVVLAEAFVAMPFLVVTVEAGLRSVDRRFEDAAATLGAGRARVAREVTLPLIAPSLIAGTVLAWARALGEFGATITFAGNIEGRTQTLPLAVYLELDSHPESAIALSLVLLAVSLVVLVGLRDRWLAHL